MKFPFKKEILDVNIVNESDKHLLTALHKRIVSGFLQSSPFLTFGMLLLFEMLNCIVKNSPDFWEEEKSNYIIYLLTHVAKAKEELQS